MSRERHEMSEEAFYEQFGKGPGDPDVHGHYPGDEDEQYCKLCHPNDYKEKEHHVGPVTISSEPIETGDVPF